MVFTSQGRSPRDANTITSILSSSLYSLYSDDERMEVNGDESTNEDKSEEVESGDNTNDENEKSSNEEGAMSDDAYNENGSEESERDL